MLLCGFQEQSQVLLADFFDLKRWVSRVEPPEIVFLDPPFQLILLKYWKNV